MWLRTIYGSSLLSKVGCTHFPEKEPEVARAGIETCGRWSVRRSPGDTFLSFDLIGQGALSAQISKEGGRHLPEKGA